MSWCHQRVSKSERLGRRHVGTHAYQRRRPERRHDLALSSAAWVYCVLHF